MKPSITYLHLLAKTPFFTGLNRKQLQWVIDHSKEWQAAKGNLIARSDSDAGSFWVLLDGSWQIETGSREYRVGHADPGKWYGADTVHAATVASRLVAATESYVMEIRLADFNEMLKQGFDFNLHLRQGVEYYQAILKP
ncbi:cyclic nucleotide-binding domain-containing protein [Collimonas sp.]|uniref:cyclic nucleotide-binding domain-containing protein n=1 Tax=Collimonas sp. TaxID=1963772 RepID=UPI002B5BF2EC|nr:cyclic nucleotide-binding domain-containing protein [Collimonas sp.]HWW04677.1 cyclic nucleotide-binding domain-containing protein [Collimonas sp.]